MGVSYLARITTPFAGDFESVLRGSPGSLGLDPKSSTSGHMLNNIFY